MKVTRPTAETWAEWFRCLADPSRLLILNLLARERRPMTVGEIVDHLDVGQSTVSHHLSLLTETCFVFVERRGTASLFRINDACLDCFPTAAQVVMGQATGRRVSQQPPGASSRRGQTPDRRRRRTVARMRRGG